MASQQLFLRWNSLASRPPQLRPQLGAAHESQAAISHPQLGAAQASAQPPQAGAAISQPQLGAAPQSLPQGAAISQPQLGAAISQPQVGPQPLSHRRPFRRLSRPPPQDGAHASAQPPQAGALISHPQLGSAAQPVSQQALSQPAPRIPNMRSNRPPPKLGVHRLAPSTRDPINILTFIEPQLPKR